MGCFFNAACHTQELLKMTSANSFKKKRLQTNKHNYSNCNQTTGN